LQIGQPDLDERSNPIVDTGDARQFERLLVAFADLRRLNALLQAVIARQQSLVHASFEIVVHPAVPYGMGTLGGRFAAASPKSRQAWCDAT
jgi:hypothetical protein